MMELEGFRLEVAEQIGQIVFDRPPVNALAMQTYEDLTLLLEDVAQRDDIDVVVIRSANPRVFCAGADIGDLQVALDSGTSDLDERRQQLARTMFSTLLKLPQPTIAVVAGAALGAGAVIASCCDIRIGSTLAKIGLPEINVARCGGGRHLMRHLPQGVLRQMYFTGLPLDAHDAHRFGLFTELHEPGEVIEAAMTMARLIASKSPIGLRVAKLALNGSEFLDVDDGYAFEQSYTLRLARTNDAREATRAFLERRPAVWTGD
jgi:enoyl-CoA hydratase/carnithine racemase